MTTRATGSRLSFLVLKVKNPAKLATFYCETLGMKRLEQHNDGIAVGYGKQGISLVFQQASTDSAHYQPNRNDRYWKIALTLPDLDCAYSLLKKQGISKISPPSQFRDIAYMSHLQDPEGFTIELLQHTFEGKPITTQGNETLPLGGGVEIGLITLRTDNMEAEMNKCVHELGLKYLSRQDVSEFGFCLYFFAPTSETKPNEDVNSIDNREWLWQRPYTSLEFQHRIDGSRIQCAGANQLGYATVLIENDNGAFTEYR